MVLEVYKIYEVTAVKVDNTLLSKQTSGFEHSDLKSEHPIFGFTIISLCFGLLVEQTATYFSKTSQFRSIC